MIFYQAEKRASQWASAVIRSLLVLVVLLSSTSSTILQAQPDDDLSNNEVQAPIAKFLTVTSPVDDVQYGRVTNAALELQNQATQQQKRGVLVLEITSGSSQFHQVHGLAKFLTSSKLSHVTTVAWIPKTVTGNNVLLALACKEIVMHPDAELGDIGRGQPVDKDDVQAIVSIVEKRHNPKISRALALAMIDPQSVTLKIQLQIGKNGDQVVESRVVTPEELERLRNNKAAILDVVTIKEAGVTGTFSGEQARAMDVLVIQTAESRGEVADLYKLEPEALREDVSNGEPPRVYVIKIEGEIDWVLESVVERQINRSIESGANMIIFEIDSPGGLLWQSRNLAFAIADLEEKKIRTIAYIPKMALSGAAIISLGCDEIYMHPNATMGDAGPIEMREGGQFEHVPEKMLSLLREIQRELAERKHRPPALAMAMADKDLKVYKVTHRETGRVWFMTDEEIHKSNGEWIKGRVVPESEKNLLLTLNGRRAHELKLAEPTVEDRDELKQRLGIPLDTKLVAVGRDWVDTMIWVLNLPAVTILLLVLGVICIYIELHITSGLLGIISAVCFSLFFWSRFLGGSAGWLEVVLFLLGVACVVLEVFVIPGFGVFGVSGGLLMMASLVLASQTFGNLAPGKDFSILSHTVGTLSASIVSVVVLALLMNKYLPRLPLLNQMILTPPGLTDADGYREPKLRPEYSGETSPTAMIEQDHHLIGKQGVAVSMLRPAGKAEIDNEFIDVVSEGPFISQGSNLEVIEVFGNRVVVRQV